MAHRFIRADAAALGLSADFGLLDAGDAADSDRPGFVKSRVTRADLDPPPFAGTQRSAAARDPARPAALARDRKLMAVIAWDLSDSLLNGIATDVNGRPRKTLEWAGPTEKMEALLR